jgi:hypothetical protein
VDPQLYTSNLKPTVSPIVDVSWAQEDNIFQEIPETDCDTFVGWSLLASEDTGRYLRLASSVILSVSLAGDGVATA